MEKVGPGKFVAYSYRLTDADNGDLLFEATEERPDVMVYGVSHEVVPGLIAAMDGLGLHDKFEVTLPPEAAFGPRFDENVMDLDKSIFMKDGVMATEVTVGAELPMMTQEGYRVLGRVLEITDDKVKMDFNHPFAGKTVTFKGRVEQLRDATPEEIQPVHGCGCGCSHDTCSDGCGDHDCGGGCCDQEGSCRQ